MRTNCQPVTLVTTVVAVLVGRKGILVAVLLPPVFTWKESLLELASIALTGVRMEAGWEDDDANETTPVVVCVDTKLASSVSGSGPIAPVGA